MTYGIQGDQGCSATDSQLELRQIMMLDAVPVGMIMVDRIGGICLINTAGEKLFGYARDELLGCPIETLIPKRARAGHVGDRSDYAVAPEASFMGAGRERFGRRKDGSEVPVEIGLTPIDTPEGQFVLASIVDLTARKQAEREMAQLRKEIAHVDRVSMMGQLASALAHELSQPLGAILRNAEAAELFMQNESPDLEEIRAILVDIRKDDQRAGHVIERMRAFLRRQEIEIRTLEVPEFIGDIVALTRSDAAARRVKLGLDLPASLPSVRGDRVQLQQVLLNLILNGIDAIDGTNDGERSVCVRARIAAADLVEIAVVDTGHGIPKERLEKLFEPFFTTKKMGMGIGLAISRTIIDAHGGRIWAENNAGRGATFRFTLKTAERNGAA